MVAGYSEVISSGKNGVFIRLLCLWKGSLYKLVWFDLVIYIVAYCILSASYRFILDEHSKKHFEKVVRLCEEVRKNIPIQFILGFFVAGVIGRWWLLYEAIPYLDSVAYYIQAFIEGHGQPQFADEGGAEDGKKKSPPQAPEKYDRKHSDRVRFHLMRYIALSWTLLMLGISEQIEKRFQFRKEVLKKPGRFMPKNRYFPSTDTLYGNSSSSTAAASDKPILKSYQQSLKPKDQFFTGESEKNEDNYNFELQEEEEKEIEGFYHRLNADPVVRNTFGVLLTEDEMRVFQHISAKHRYMYGKSCGLEYWIPLQWASRIVQKAGIQGYLCDPKLIAIIIGRINRLREEMLKFYHQSEIIMPLVYTQVVIIVVYTYFMAQLFASQFVAPAEMVVNGTVHREHSKSNKSQIGIDMVVPIFEILVFLFLIGWLKVALCVMNPFGSDDEDFEISTFFISNVHRCYEAAVSRTYPKHLKRATMEYFMVNSAKEDNLREYLEENSRQLQWELNELAANDENILGQSKKKRNFLRNLYQRMSSFWQ